MPQTGKPDCTQSPSSRFMFDWWLVQQIFVDHSSYLFQFFTSSNFDNFCFRNPIDMGSKTQNKVFY